MASPAKVIAARYAQIADCTASAAKERLDLPSGMQTYATADLTRAVQVFEEHGARFLSQEEVSSQLPPNPTLL